MRDLAGSLISGEGERSYYVGSVLMVYILEGDASMVVFLIENLLFTVLFRDLLSLGTFLDLLSPQRLSRRLIGYFLFLYDILKLF